MSRSLLIQNGLMLTFIDDGYNAIKIKQGDILIEDGVVKKVGGKINADCETIDAEGKLVVPGMIDAHSHCFLSKISKGMSEDINRTKWKGSLVYKRVYPLVSTAIETLSDDEIRSLLKLSVFEAINSGTTTLIDQGFDRDINLFIELLEQYGLRAAIAPMVSSLKKLPEGAQDGSVDYLFSNRRGEAGLKKNLDLWKRYNGSAEGRISVLLGLLSPDACSEDLLKAVKEAAEEKEILITMSAAATQAEVDKLKTDKGITPIRYLSETGILGPNTILSNMLFVDSEEIKLLRLSGTQLVVCPQAAAKDALLAPMVDYLIEDTNTAIGTSHYTADVFSEMKICALVGKIQTQRAHQVQASDAFYSATVAGSRVLRRNDLGRIDEGCKGDVLILDLEKAHTQPMIFPAVELVYNAMPSDIETVIVDGKVLKKDGRVLGMDEKQIVRDANAAFFKIWEQSKIRGIF